MNHFQIYKKSAALQCDIIRAKANNGFLQKQGALLFNVANAIPGKDKVYDWSKKITFAFSSNDYPLFYNAIYNYQRGQEMKLDLVHNPNAGKADEQAIYKKLMIASGQNPGTFFITFFSGDLKVSVPLTMGEFLMLKRFIEDNQNIILGVENAIVEGD
jgi:hypothetical protein